MKTLKNSLILALGLVFSLSFLGTAEAKKKANIAKTLRVQHAQELLGAHYKKSAVRSGEKVKNMKTFITRWVNQRLPEKHKYLAPKVIETVINESIKFSLDPLFVLAMIQGESSFNPDCFGSLDEIGLMQLRPGTAEWVAKMYGMKYVGPETLLDPVVNIKIGIAFVAHLREKFDSHAQLYLSAYNMGARNVAEARERKVWPKIYATHVMKYYIDFYEEIDRTSKKS